MVGEGNNLKPKAIRILESYIKSIFTLVQIQYAEQPEGRVVRIPPPLLKTIFEDIHYLISAVGDITPMKIRIPIARDVEYLRCIK